MVGTEEGAEGTLAAFIVPQRWSGRLPLDLCWMMLIASLFATLIYDITLACPA